MCLGLCINLILLPSLVNHFLPPWALYQVLRLDHSPAGALWVLCVDVEPHKQYNQAVATPSISPNAVCRVSDTTVTTRLVKSKDTAANQNLLCGQFDNTPSRLISSLLGLLGVLEY